MNRDDDKKLKALDLKIARALQIDVPPLVMPELPDIDEKIAALPGASPCTWSQFSSLKRSRA